MAYIYGALFKTSVALYRKCYSFINTRYKLFVATAAQGKPDRSVAVSVRQTASPTATMIYRSHDARWVRRLAQGCYNRGERDSNRQPSDYWTTGSTFSFRGDQGNSDQCIKRCRHHLALASWCICDTTDSFC